MTAVDPRDEEHVMLDGDSSSPAVEVMFTVTTPLPMGTDVQATVKLVLVPSLKDAGPVIDTPATSSSITPSSIHCEGRSR